MYGYLLATVNTTGAMGTVCNWEQHTFPALLDESAAKLTEAPRRTRLRRQSLGQTYDAEPRIIVPAIRTAISPGEDLVVPIIMLDSDPPQEVLVHFRPLGTKKYTTEPADPVGRNTYQATIPAGDLPAPGLEYHLEAETDTRGTIQWPAGVGMIDQTVIQGP